MNENSRGGGGPSGRGDPPIGGYPPPSSTTTPSSEQGTSGASSTTTATSTTSNDLSMRDCDLDNLGEGLSLTRLLAGDSSWEFSDALAATSQHNQQSGSYNRPWEAMGVSTATPSSSTTSTITSLDGSSATSSTFTTLTSVPVVAPPNVLAPPSTIPRPPHQSFYQPHHYNSGLPSFQSQFQEVPPPPHYAGATPTHHYPLVPPPVQAREIPNIQQQFLDERHIHNSQHLNLYSHTPLAQPRPHYPTASRLAAHITATPTSHLRTKLNTHHHERATPSSDVTSLNAVEAHPTLAAQLRKKTARAGSLEGSESDHSSVDTPGQVAAISSTDPTPETLAGLADAFKPHGGMSTPSGGGVQHPTPSMGVDDPDKPSKKKRKRCGECTGCQKKDNCGECAPCRNDKSHQICKLRRCDKLTEKKPRKPNVSQSQYFFRNCTVDFFPSICFIPRHLELNASLEKLAKL